jgi:hypothetical protein
MPPGVPCIRAHSRHGRPSPCSFARADGTSLPTFDVPWRILRRLYLAAASGGLCSTAPMSPVALTLLQACAYTRNGSAPRSSPHTVSRAGPRSHARPLSCKRQCATWGGGRGRVWPSVGAQRGLEVRGDLSRTRHA